MLLSPKKLILLGLGFILLIAIPLTVYLVQKQQEIRGRAAPSTKISLEPSSKTAAVNDNVRFELWVDPGKTPNNNSIIVVTLTLTYDPRTLEITSSGVVIDRTVLPNELQPPVISANSIFFSYGLDRDVEEAITERTKIGTITFKAKVETGATPTTISFDPERSHALSNAADDPNKDVVLPSNGYQSATVTISGVGGVTPAPRTSVSPTPGKDKITPTTPPSPTSPTPTTGASQATPTPTTSTPVPTTPPGTGSANQLPVCSSLVLDRSAQGTVPYTIAFTVAGSDSDGTIGKASFSFGDGTVQDVTEGGGIGTNSINTGLSHTYNSAGTFTASVTLTDEDSGISNSCTQVITVQSGVAEAPPPVAPPIATPTIEPAGPTEVLLGIGAIGFLFIIIGGALLFIL